MKNTRTNGARLLSLLLAVMLILSSMEGALANGQTALMTALHRAVTAK